MPTVRQLLIAATALAVASPAPAVAASSPVFRALQACINAANGGLAMLGDGPITRWGAGCEGATAAKLWSTLYSFSASEERKTQSDKSQTDLLHIGKNSYCIKILRNADQTPGNHVECILYLDLDGGIESATHID